MMLSDVTAALQAQCLSYCLELHSTYTLRVAHGDGAGVGHVRIPSVHVLQQVIGEMDDRFMLERELTVLTLVLIPVHVQPSVQ